MENGPVHALAEIEYSPYYRHIIYKSRTLAFYLLSKTIGDCKDEATWFEQCFRPGYEIDMPQIQGALYIKNCHSLSTCWFVTTDGQKPSKRVNGNDYSEDVEFEEQMRLYKPWQRTLIQDNYFYNNHANLVMFETQAQP